MTEQEKNKEKKEKESTADHKTTKNLEDFINKEEENFNDKNFDDKDFDTDQNSKKGIAGISAKEATALITNMVAENIPEQKRAEFLKTYPVKVETLLEFIGFEELSEGANVKEMPSWVRILILVVGVGGLTFASIKKYKPVNNNQKQQQKQKEEGWKE